MPHEPDKSIGAEETFARDVDDPRRGPPRAAAAVPSAPPPGCAPAGLAGRTVAIKVRFADFTTITRSRTLPRAHRRRRRRLRHRPRALRGARPGPGPAPAGRRPGRGAGRVRVRARTSCCSASAAQGRREAEQAADRAAPGSAAARCGRPAWSATVRPADKPARGQPVRSDGQPSSAPPRRGRPDRERSTGDDPGKPSERHVLHGSESGFHRRRSCAYPVSATTTA